MKTSTKTLLVSAIAMACAGGVYAQGAGGSAGAGGGAGGGMRGGNTPSGNTLEQPSIQPGTSGNTTSTYERNKTMRSHRNSGGYGSPGTTGSNSGRSTVSPGMDQQNPSGATGTTGGYSAPQDQTYHGRQQ
jgi:hypothetical protein